MLKILCVLVTLWSTYLMAESRTGQTPPLWTSESWAEAIKAMPKGDVQRGEHLDAKAYCATCHGDKGVAPSRNTPSLAGQDPLYIYKALMDFKSGLWHIDNKSLGMHALTLPMNKQDMADLAAFYGVQVRPHQTNAAAVSAPPVMAACTTCHPASGDAGPAHSGPALGGQSVYYLVRQLNAFKHHRRNTDVGGLMGSMAQMLSDKQQEAIAKFYAQQ